MGEPAGKSHLEKAGVAVGSYKGGKLSADQVLDRRARRRQQLAANAAAWATWLKAGGHLLAIGLDQADADAVAARSHHEEGRTHRRLLRAVRRVSPLAGVGPADVHNRDPKEFSLVSGGATVVGDGVLATADEGQRRLLPTRALAMRLQQGEAQRQADIPPQFVPGDSVVGQHGRRGRHAVLARFSSPVKESKETPERSEKKAEKKADNSEKRWLDGFYLDEPQDWDNPYRAFRW